MKNSIQRRLEGRIAMVVGGGADGPARREGELPIGIGRAIATRLSHEGAIVAVTDLSRQRALETTEILEGKGLAISADAENPDDCRRAVEIVEAELGPPEIVVGSVGISGGMPLRAQTVEDWDRSVAINSRAHWITAQSTLQVMLDRGSGVFVFVTSLAALRSSGASLSYDMTKTALLGLTRHITARYANRGIRSNSVALGVFDSTMVRRAYGNSLDDHLGRDAMSPTGRQGKPEEAAAAVAFLASDDASYVNGTVLIVDGGISAVMGF